VTLHLFLPPLKDGHDVVTPPKAGVWSNNAQKILRSIAESIPIGDTSDDRGVSSVPDVWARPMMFAAALRPTLVGHQAHPLRKRTVQEWRGLMSLLALREIQAARVEIQHVKLDDGKFSTALKTLKPEDIPLEAAQKYSWLQLAVITVSGVPVGAFSPASIVYTATSYRERLLKVDYGLKDELGYLRPPNVQKEAELTLFVAKWLREFKTYLSDASAGRTPVLDLSGSSIAKPQVELLNSLIDDWLDELTAELGIEALSADASNTVSVGTIANSPFEKQYRVYNAALRPLRFTGGAQMLQSGYELKFDSARGRAKYKHVVVISAELLRENDVVWGLTKLGDLGGDPERALAKHFRQDSGTVLPGHDLGKHEAVWIRPEKFFLSPILLQAAKGGEFSREDPALVGRDRRFVLPLKRQILEFFSVSEILERLRPTFTEVDGAIEFSIQLRVGDRQESVRRVYRKQHATGDEGQIRDVIPAALEIFPRYVDKHWRRYYMMHDSGGTLSFEPLVAGREVGVETRVHAAANGSSRVRIVQLTGAESFPEAVEVHVASDNSDPRAVGLILFAPPVEPHGLAGQMRVGVDFGTSNTNVFIRVGDSKAIPWTIDFPRHLLRVTAGMDASRDALLRACFVPDALISLPIPTHLRLFNESERRHPLLDYFIFFSNDLHVPENVYTDIKWEEEGARKAQHFLESVLLLLLLEAVTSRVARIVMAYSYPKAFSSSMYETYRGDWRGELNELTSGKDRVLDARTVSGERDHRLDIVGPFEETEGVAAGRFFGSEETIPSAMQRASIATAAVCLDVGGGTTDISVWFRSEIAFDASVRLAGREVADALRRNPRVLDLLMEDPEAARALEDKREHPSQFASRLNLVLRNSDASVAANLRRFGAADPQLQWLRRLIVVEFGAIAFYVGSTIAAADRIKPGLLDAFAASEVALHWGGNGAKFLNWLGLGSFDEDSPGARFLNALLYQSLRESNQHVDSKFFAQRQSPGHKQEASGGLVVIEERLLRKSTRSSLDDYEVGDISHGTVGLVCGEDIELTSGPLSHLDEISEAVLFGASSTTFVRTRLTRLNRFVELVNAFGVRFGLMTESNRIVLDERVQRKIESQISGGFIEQQSRKPGQRLVEPVFIAEVKLLLELITSGNV